MKLRLLARRAVSRYRERGLLHTLGKVVTYCSDFARSGFRHPGYQDARVDMERRWELFEQHLSEDDASVIDIGCAEGELTRKFAERGLFSIGLDTNDIRLTAAIDRHRLQDNLGFFKFTVGPENVRKLPETDVVLLLAVYHHWKRSYGLDAAESMLRHLAANAEKLFLEPPNGPIEGDEHDGGTDDMVAYNRDYLRRVLGESVNIEHLGTVDRMGESARELFVIRTAEFDD